MEAIGKGAHTAGDNFAVNLLRGVFDTAREVFEFLDVADEEVAGILQLLQRLDHHFGHRSRNGGIVGREEQALQKLRQPGMASFYLQEGGGKRFGRSCPHERFARQSHETVQILREYPNGAFLPRGVLFRGGIRADRGFRLAPKSQFRRFSRQ